MSFLKTTLAGGFFFVLPVVLLYLLLAEALEVAMALGTPIADLLPEGFFGDAETAKVVAVLYLIVICFLTGLVLRTQTGHRIIAWLENKLLEPIPGYTVLRDLSERISGDETSKFFQPAVLTHSDGIKQPVLIVEEHAQGDYSVLVPIAPTPTLGTIHIVPKAKIEKVDLPTTEALECFWHLGVGTEKLLRNVKKEH